jgi:hypothetical protein
MQDDGKEIDHISTTKDKDGHYTCDHLDDLDGPPCGKKAVKFYTYRNKHSGWVWYVARCLEHNDDHYDSATEISDIDYNIADVMTS